MRENPKPLIAVVEDEEDILDLVSLHLLRAGFEVEKFSSASGFFQFLEKEIPQLVILDLMLPDADGIDICKYLKSNEKLSSIFIIMLTARSTESDKVLGLELGADDYITKPFSPRELIARVKAVLRRKATSSESRKLLVGDKLLIDLDRYEVFVDGKKVKLTTTEFKILSLLAKKKGWVFSRAQILEHLWGEEKLVLDRTVDVHIRNLREKLGQAARFIVNVKGIGYKIEG